jgi:hypothetical protein
MLGGRAGGDDGSDGGGYTGHSRNDTEYKSTPPQAPDMLISFWSEESREMRIS